MANYNVSNSSELQAALSKATGGDTITLAGGDYGSLELDSKSGFDIQYSSEVTIRSADPSNPATFSYMKLGKAENITIDGVVFDYSFSSGDTKYTRAFEISDSNNISIRNSEFVGDENPSDGLGTAQGLNVSDSSAITLENNEFSVWHRALIVGDSSDVTVRGNDVHSCRSDGLDFYAVQNLLVEDNYIHDFAGSDDPGDHRDFIQFWTNGTNTPSTNVTIRDNVLDIGDGAWAQSIFIRNEEVDNGRAGEEMYYRDFLIENNLIINSHLHGITTGETKGLVIRNNHLASVVPNPDETANALLMEKYGASSELRVPTIRANPASDNVTIEGNTFYGAPEYHDRNQNRVMNTESDKGFSGAPGGWTISNNDIFANQTGSDARDDYFNGSGPTPDNTGGNGGDNSDDTPGNEGGTQEGGRQNDWLYGGDGGDLLRGHGGVDRLFGASGNDTAEGGDGNDIVYAGAGADKVHGGANEDRLDGGAGNDLLLGEAGHDTLIGSTGDDTMDGGWHNDWLYGGDGNDVMQGDGGVDRLFGEDGNDLLESGDGNDVVYAGAGADKVHGGANEDRLDGGAGNDLLLGEAGHDTLVGSTGDDTMEGGWHNDWLYGGAGDDVMRGDGGVDRLFGENGDDLMDGGHGNDILYAGAGDDTVRGGAGDDRVDGGHGDDVLSGGIGQDIYFFTNGFGDDTITDFEVQNALERIDLSGVSRIGDYGDLRANHMVQSGADVLIDDGAGNTITLLDTQMADMDPGDFLF